MEFCAFWGEVTCTLDLAGQYSPSSFASAIVYAVYPLPRSFLNSQRGIPHKLSLCVSALPGLCIRKFNLCTGNRTPSVCSGWLLILGGALLRTFNSYSMLYRSRTPSHVDRFRKERFPKFTGSLKQKKKCGLFLALARCPFTRTGKTHRKLGRIPRLTVDINRRLHQY